ncbi:hypothetical protein PoB_004932500 [Plakobranchus ocellatus]|uniref:Uncharacterized protein n=1 Tax=Plakobranchus ocellatus TaxID=259542 RepID=A0AAV4BU44_9GAST|nr:hypothetical protein PoB_004932500 [Plakobranchus ocellatus]
MGDRRTSKGCCSHEGDNLIVTLCHDPVFPSGNSFNQSKFQDSIEYCLMVRTHSDLKFFIALENIDSRTPKLRIQSGDAKLTPPGTSSPQQGDLKLSCPLSGKGAGGGARTRNRKVPAGRGC